MLMMMMMMLKMTVEAPDDDDDDDLMVMEDDDDDEEEDEEEEDEDDDDDAVVILQSVWPESSILIFLHIFNNCLSKLVNQQKFSFFCLAVRHETTRFIHVSTHLCCVFNHVDRHQIFSMLSHQFDPLS